MIKILDYESHSDKSEAHYERLKCIFIPIQLIAQKQKRPDLSNDKPGLFMGKELIASDTSAALRAA